MNEPKMQQSKAISRRTFCRSAITAAVALHYIKPSAMASENNKVKFYKNLGPGHIGVRANQRQALEYAVKYGFDSITPSPGEFQNKSTSEIRDWLKLTAHPVFPSSFAETRIDLRQIWHDCPNRRVF